MGKIYTFFIGLTLSLLLLSCSSNSNEKLIMDEANVLQNNKELLKQYSDYNEYILKDFDIDFRVITTNSQEDVNIFTNKRFNALKSRSSSGKTILLVINIAQDISRVEVSMALEPIYTDAFISYVERVGMVPYFRDSKIADGIYMMSELIRDRANESRHGLRFTPPMQSGSIGAGAKTKANISNVDKNAKNGRNIRLTKGDTPKDIWDKYMQSLVELNKNPKLAIFTEDTKKFFSSWTVTDINQKNELRFASKCQNGKYYIYQDHAVLLYPIKPRTCSPYFFKVEEGSWKIDIATMAKVIRFNKEMQWHFDMNEKAKVMQNYEFSFTHFQYDENGFPFYKKRKKLRWGFTCSPWYKPQEKEKIRCMITWLDKNGRAKNDLGLKIYDRIISTGKGSLKQDEISLDDFMLYMKNVSSGDSIDVTLIGRDEVVKELHTTAP